jgi:hypothetical protein
MIQLSVFVAAATLGFDVGWQRLPEGGMEYIIQLDPQTLDALRSGQVLQSDIPSAAGEVRSYRIVVGGQRPPRESPLPRPAPVAKVETKVRAAPPAAQPPPRAEHRKQETAPIEPAKPWLPLTLTLFGLFASLASNLYLGWIAAGLWRRCRRAAPGRSSAAVAP